MNAFIENFVGVNTSLIRLILFIVKRKGVVMFHVKHHYSFFT